MNEEIQEKISLWDKLYDSYTPTFLGVRMYAAHRKVLKVVMNDILAIPKDWSILDLGCGQGSTLTSLREWGFKNSIGIDLSTSGLRECQDKGFILGKDVFEVDGTNSPYDTDSFDVIFSEGTLEHYENFMPFVKEMTRLANKYVILIQPNHFSLYGGLIQYGWRLLRRNAGGVEELTYHLEDFYSAFCECGFSHIRTDFTTLRENAVLVFRKCSTQDYRLGEYSCTKLKLI